jgi:hypothetical protein
MHQFFRTFIPDKNIVRQPHLEEIIQSVLRRQKITTDAQTFIQQAQSGNLIFIFDGLLWGVFNPV